MVFIFGECEVPYCMDLLAKYFILGSKKFIPIVFSNAKLSYMKMFRLVSILFLEKIVLHENVPSGQYIIPRENCLT